MNPQLQSLILLSLGIAPLLVTTPLLPPIMPYLPPREVLLPVIAVSAYASDLPAFASFVCQNIFCLQLC